MKSKIGKEILLSEIKRRTKELEIRNVSLEEKCKEFTVILDNLSNSIDEKKKLLSDLEIKKKQDEDKIKEDMDKIILEYEEQWNKLVEKSEVRLGGFKELAIVQCEDGFNDLVDIKSLKAVNNIITWVENKYIPKEVLHSSSKENYPLPKEFYIDQREGKAWAQMHFRGIEPDKYKAIQDKKMELWEVLIGQSAHIDIRVDYGIDKLVQFVMTENDIQSMVNTLTGVKRKTANGIMNVQHSKIVSKPSGEPEGNERYYKAEEPQLASIDAEGAKLAQSLDLEGSYWIEPGGIGATVNTYSYMMLIWEGKIITGTERHDLHELFMYKENAKQELFNGKFTIKCLDDGTTKRWEIWKAISEPFPMDSILHADCGYHWLVPEEKVDGIGREYYRNVSQELFRKKYV